MLGVDPASAPGAVTGVVALVFGLAPVGCLWAVGHRVEWLPADGHAGAVVLLTTTLATAVVGLVVVPGAPAVELGVPGAIDLLWMALASPLLFGVGLVAGVATLRIPLDRVPPPLVGGARARTGDRRLVVATVLLAGVGEELMFRGFVQASLTASFGPAVGIGVAAVAFGLSYWPAVARRPREIDLDGLARLALTAGGGAVLGVLYVATDNLLVPIVGHTVHAGALAVIRTRR